MKPTSSPAPRRFSLRHRSLVEMLESRIAPATLTVTTLLDVVGADGFVSLREAIQAANTNLAVNEAAAGDLDGDTISFDPSLSGSVELASALSILDDLSIDGSVDAGVITVDGLSATQLFHIDTSSGVGTNKNVALSNLDLDHGSVAGNGGAIEHLANKLTLTSVDISNSDATGPGASGGAIFNGAILSLTEVTISHNTSVRAGGGIEAAAGSVTTIENSVLTHNTTNGAPGNGGGLHITGNGVVTINNSEVSENTAFAEGGGLWNSATGSLTVTGSLIYHNTADGDGTEQGGGGLFNDGGTVLVKDTSFEKNVATAAALGNGGGAIFNDGTMTLIRVDFSENTASSGSAKGGAILNSDNGVLVVSAGRIYDNTAALAGGGVENNLGSVTLNSVQLVDNHAGTNGGGLHNTGAGVVIVNGGLVSANDAANEGGGLWNSALGTMTITGAEVTGNEAATGGGIFQKGAGGTLNVTNSTLSYNKATGALGGGGVALEGGTATIVQSTIGGNDAAAGAGGGLLVSGGVVNISNSTIASNCGLSALGLQQNGGSVSLVSTIIGANGTDDVIRSAGTLNATSSLITTSSLGAVNGTDTTNIYGQDPLLGDLQDNGGLTETFALQPGSPAVNHGSNPNGLTTDQRGTPFARTNDPVTDIGSFEAPPEPMLNISANGRKATYTDVDGDLVTITTSAGTFDQGNFLLVGEGIGARLFAVNLDGQTEFAGANISIKAQRSARGGDGFANVSYFGAHDVDLGKVIVDGDLGAFFAGDANTATPGVIGLNVVSMGEFDHVSEIGVVGEFKALTVRTDLTHTFLTVSGGAAGKLDVLKVSGSILQGDFLIEGGLNSFNVTGSVIFTHIEAEAGIGSITATAVPGKYRLSGGVFIKGSVIASTIGTNGDLANIRVSGDFNQSYLSVRGDAVTPDLLTAQTIGSLIIGGRVNLSDFYVGYDLDLNSVNADVQVGLVTIGGGWVGSNLAVGIEEGADGLYGTTDDEPIAGGNASIVSRIANATFKGQNYGTIGQSGDHFGIVAQEIVKLKAGLAFLPLTAGAGTDLTPINVGVSFDFAVREVSAV